MKNKYLIGIVYILASIMFFAFASCTGGNESLVGNKTFTDYLPSIFMVLGAGGIGYGVYHGLTKDSPKFSSVRTKQFLIWSAIVFLFGLFTYFS
jgi:hypothetical protein